MQNPCIKKGFSIKYKMSNLRLADFFLFISKQTKIDFYFNIRPNIRVLFKKCNSAIFQSDVSNRLMWS